MKNIILTLVFLTLCTGVSSAQYVLSPRIGEEIDQTERNYFGLFPAIQGFRSATAISRIGSIEFIITRTEKADTTIIADSTTAKNLVRYIENFESYRRSQNEVNWDTMAGLAASSPALQNEMGEGAESTIVTLNGVQLTGKLLYASGGSLVLLKNYDNNGKWWNSLSKQE